MFSGNTRAEYQIRKLLKCLGDNRLKHFFTTMPASITDNISIEDVLDFYNQEGETTRSTAAKFGISPKTCHRLLLKHPNYKPKGKGNKYATGKKAIEPRSKIRFWIPCNLLTELDSLSSNRSETIIKAIAYYLECDHSRIKSVNAKQKTSKLIGAKVPDRLVKALEKLPGSINANAAKAIANYLAFRGVKSTA